MHAATPRFRSLVGRTLRLIREIDAEGLRLFCALSGGKDSTALAGLLHEAGVPFHAVHVHTELNTPGTRETVEALVARLGCSLDVYEPVESVWDLLAEPVVNGHDPLFNRASSGSLLVAYTYDGPWDGSWTGMRADESRGRCLNARVRGALYRLKADGKWIAQPMLWWSVKDVYAYIVSRGLPLHPHYQRAYERLGVSPERSRVDCLVTAETVAALGAHAEARALYPELWSRIEEARPRLQHTR